MDASTYKRINVTFKEGGPWVEVTLPRSELCDVLSTGDLHGAKLHAVLFPGVELILDFDLMRWRMAGGGL